MMHEKELIDLLDNAPTMEEDETGILSEQRVIIENTFRAFGLGGKFVRAYIAEQVNCYEFTLQNNEKFERYQCIRTELLMTLKAREIRIVAGETCRVEVARERRRIASAGELFRANEWQNASGESLMLMLGKNVDGAIETVDLSVVPHLLIVGVQGAGKTVLADLVIFSLMLKHGPDELKLILIDPYLVDFEKYKDLPYLLFPPLNNETETIRALLWLNAEMNSRYELMRQEGCRDISSFNAKKPGALPYIVMVINELSELIQENSIQAEKLITSLCAKSRAAGIHLVVCSRPYCLTDGIKANIPMRILFAADDKKSSQRVIGSGDGVHLLGNGDMLFCTGGSPLKRIQGGYINDDESDRMIAHIKEIYKDWNPVHKAVLPNVLFPKTMICRDELMEVVKQIIDEQKEGLANRIVDSFIDKVGDIALKERHQAIESETTEEPQIEDLRELLAACRIIIDKRCISISLLQRQLGIGFNRAFAIIKALKQHGVISNDLETILVNSIDEAKEKIRRS